MTQDWARPVVHWEIQARDPELIKDFYAQMFNWDIAAGPIKVIGPGIGAPEVITGHIMAAATSAVVLYIQVLDLRTTLDKAKTLGGTITLEPFQIPDRETIAGITDPEGNRIALVQQ